jgi:hypothetical protein
MKPGATGRIQCAARVLNWFMKFDWASVVENSKRNFMFIAEGNELEEMQ